MKASNRNSIPIEDRYEATRTTDYCDCCHRERPIEGVYANPFFPTSDGYCKECVEVGATPLWCIPFPYFRMLNHWGETDYHLDEYLVFNGYTNEYISAAEAIKNCGIDLEGLKDQEDQNPRLKFALHKYLYPQFKEFEYESR